MLRLCFLRTLSPQGRRLLCVCSLPLRDKGQVSHPLKLSPKEEDDSCIQTYTKESDRNSLPAEPTQVDWGYLQTGPEEAESQQESGLTHQTRGVIGGLCNDGTWLHF